MTQNKAKYENCLNVHLLAFVLPKDLINDNDEVRVSVTTIPEENKQCFFLQGNKMNNSNHIFSLNITDQTKKIIMVFRKKNISSEYPIIASATIHLVDFENVPQKQMVSGIITTQVKVLNLYYPLQKQMIENKEENKKFARKVLGKMRIQLSFAAPYSSVKINQPTKTNKIEFKFFGSKSRYNKRKGMKGEYLNILNDDENENYSLLQTNY
ncbi:hypothetical protein M9Y10_034397 [Tritrichomonas musculus]|uniref:Uncharacterized protein n=1 Tax=Tritrichomonas musculus TaxID=1915356 RepID=A0ABR2KET4_9EUKA